jgi:uncharacterized protein YjbJ (UPF0337 family)
MQNNDELKGKMDQAKGKAKEAAGDITGNDRLHDEGKVDEMGGNARETIGKGRRKVGEALDDLGDKMKH